MTPKPFPTQGAQRHCCLSFAFFALILGACAETPKSASAGPRLVAEWEPAVGTLVAFPFELPDDLVRDLAAEAPLFLLVGDADRAAAAEKLRALGVDAARTELVPTAAQSPWTRDWGPHQVEQPDGSQALVDHVFRGYPWVPADCAPVHITYRMGRMEGEDEAVPALARALGLATVSLPAIATGGNLLTDGQGRAFCTRAQIVENHDLADEGAYRALLRDILGVTDLVVLENTEPLGIQHIDCWMKVIDPETLLVKAAPAGHPEQAPIERNVALLSRLTTPAGGRYRIVRIDCPPFFEDFLPAYTNSLRLGDVVHVPLFGGEADERALATYRAVLPDCEVRCLGHAPAPAGRAEAAALAGEGHQLVASAARAVHAREAAGEDAGVEVVVELLAHEAGQPWPTTVVRAHDEGLEVAQEHPVERSSLRLAAGASGSGLWFPAKHAGTKTRESAGDGRSGTIRGNRARKWVQRLCDRTGRGIPLRVGLASGKSAVEHLG